MSKDYRQQIKDYLTIQFNLTDKQINSMIPGLISTLGDHMAKLEIILESGNLKELGRAGHTMKGAALNLGLGECAEIASEIELKGKAEDQNVDFQGLIKAMRENIDKYIN